MTLAAAEAGYRAAHTQSEAIRREAIEVMHVASPRANVIDTNYVFLSFVVANLPAGLVGLMLAAVFAASMNSTSAELNALASTTVVDAYRRLLRPAASERHYVLVSRAATVAWGGFAVAFAEYAGRLGSLIEAVNILGSLFYGTILGVFLVAFFVRRVGGTAVFLAAIVGETAVLACFALTAVSFLWYNVVGCAVVMATALLLSLVLPRREGATSPRPSTPR